MGLEASDTSHHLDLLFSLCLSDCPRIFFINTAHVQFILPAYIFTIIHLNVYGIGPLISVCACSQPINDFLHFTVILTILRMCAHTYCACANQLIRGGSVGHS